MTVELYEAGGDAPADDSPEAHIRGIRLCLAQMEKEAREYGADLSALLIRAAAESLLYRRRALPEHQIDFVEGQDE